ncbi:ubiquitin-like modifier-activating enzyme ATG7 isoform X2 [Corticium candelabrum]|nr:ubiquitin-like modifier-activating enzyme ATG7 isoform X2 [Corticium candelabrum]
MKVHFICSQKILSTTHGRHSLAHGHLVVTNTLEKFKTADKVHLLSEAGRRVWESIVSGRAVDNPSLLVQFFLFTFADLKKYYFYYWFAFPALCPEDTVVAEEAVSIETCFNSKQMSTLQSRWAKLPTSSDRSFFLVAVSGDGVDVALLKDYETFCKFHPK